MHLEDCQEIDFQGKLAVRKFTFTQTGSENINTTQIHTTISKHSNYLVIIRYAGCMIDCNYC